ncbi:MAG: aminoacyl-histidine dipeptidase [Saprospiraceae bacterium]|nr:aminoacyl-histidine dipeptidase [Saprospiraceae bacterium]
MTIRQLEPLALWNNFADLNEVPRPSKQEERAIAFMKAFGERIGLETIVDGVGNVVIKKPATPGMENRKTVVLQGHLDMVHQKNADTVFDFNLEGIRSIVDGEWVKAQGTTLGADNGIGVASIMTVLASDGIPHPAIEALFTIDEETGMTGAKELAGHVLTGDILLNLDSEEDNELTIGCAGGLNTNSVIQYAEEPTPAGFSGLRIGVTGLKGGHSGIDIHLGRGNANKLMNRLLFDTGAAFGLRISEIDGGGLRNAIPREAFAIVALPTAREADFRKEFDNRKADLLREFRSVEPALIFDLAPAPLPAKVMAADDQERMLRSIAAMPNGVFRMSPDIPGLVETSSNLARVSVKDGEFTTLSLQRSSVESGKAEIAQAVRAVFELAGATVEHSGDYPGWAPNPQSPILAEMVTLYEKLFGDKPHVAACHAGLECGIIGEHYPGMDMISFGPTIRHPHSPDEKVHIASVQKFWKYLKAILAGAPLKVA